MNLFKKKKYEISFRKIPKYMPGIILSWEQISDGYILKVLSDIQGEYGFDIISVKIKDTISDSNIVIKCDKDIADKVIIEFGRRLSGDIQELTWK